MLGEKNGGKNGVWMGGKKWPAACWVGETKERKGKQNKTKEKAGRLLVVGWGERREREREREKACCFVPGWVGKKKKKKACCVPAGWVGERKEREKKKKKRPAVHVAGWEKEKGREGKKKKKSSGNVSKSETLPMEPKIKNFNVIPNLIVWLAFFFIKKITNVARNATLVTVK
jgi:hypothetical protein